ncbi:MAG: hypothetical protein MUC49_04385 [Raineya sp.]|jgi:hypothetical protein|nr:hypothetical protein [Raineya sp.]
MNTKRILVAFGLMFLQIFTHAQNKTDKYLLNIEYDFENDILEPHPKKYWVRERGRIEFKIKNINLFNYNVNINNSKQDYLNPSNNSNIINSYNSLLPIVETGRKILDEIPVFTTSITSSKTYFDRDSKLYFKRIFNGDNEVKMRINNIKNYLNSYLKDNTYSSYNKEFNQYILYYQGLYYVLISDKTTNDKKKDTENLLNTFFFNDIQRNPNVPKELIPMTQISSITNKYLDLLKKQLFIISEAETEVDVIEAIIGENNYLEESTKKAFLELKTLLKTLQEKYRKAIAFFSSNSIEEFTGNISKIHIDGFDRGNHEINIKEYDLNNIDKVELEISIEPNKNASNYKNRKEKFKTIINTYGGLRFDVSAGLVFNFNLNDREYYYDNSLFGNDTVTIVRKKDRNTYIPFLGTQLNVYINKPFKSPFSFGTAIGISTNLTDAVRYSLGGCVVIGNKDRIILSGGITGAPVNVLSGRYEENRPYPRNSLPELPETVKAFKIGQYFSITYNFSSQNTKNFSETLTKK